MHTVGWAETDAYEQNLFSPVFVAEGRFGNNAFNGTHELDLGDNTATPRVTNHFVWANNTEYAFSVQYTPSPTTPDRGTVVLTNAATQLSYTLTVDWSPTDGDAIFLRARSAKPTAVMTLNDLKLTAPTLDGETPVPIPATDTGYPPTSGDPTATPPIPADPGGVQATFAQGRNALQITGVDLQAGFTLTGKSRWTFAASGANKPSQSNLAFQVKVGTLAHIDLNIFKPAVIDVSETPIPEADEFTQGSATFVNLDNDDNDPLFDNSDNAVAGGDDELARLQVRVPRSLAGGTVKIIAPAGGADVRLWYSNDKSLDQYALGDHLSVPGDFTAEGNYLVKDLWVEGIAPQALAQGTKLKAELSEGDTVAAFDDVALTVIGVGKVEWVGYDNAHDDSSILDADPNWPAGLTPAAWRVFPDKRVINLGASYVLETDPRTIVRVKTTLSVAPPIDVKVHVRAFDVDDPTADANAVDDETAASDNRGAAGTFGWKSDPSVIPNPGVTPTADVTKEVAFVAGATDVLAEYIVSTQPGDNFRLVANADNDFLLRLNNNDYELNVGGAAANANKQRIVNQHVPVASTPADREVREADKYCSDVLTVWRFMHVETDSMARPTNNRVNTTITSITANATGQFAARVFTAANPLQLPVDVTGSGDFVPDNTANLSSSPAEPGRFQNGQVVVGAGTLSTTTSVIDGNGNNFVQKDAGISVRFEANDNDVFGNDTFSGFVTALSGTTFTVRVTAQSATPIDWPDFIGGTLNVAGTSMDITGVNGPANTITVGTLGNIPVEVHDDDVDAVLPGTIDYTDLQATDNVATNRFAPAYIRPVHDGGGNPANNQNDVPAVLNTEYSDVYRWQSRINSSSQFWVVYHLAAFQDSYQNLTTDFDADPGTAGVTESGTWASANNAAFGTADRGGGVLFYLESMRDGSLSTAWRARVTVHETGHNFGLMDLRPSANTPATAGIMWYTAGAPASAAADYFFRPEDLNTIRSALAPAS